MEEWRVIEEFPNYEVSSFGRVRTIKTGLIRKQHINSKGYYRVTLKNKKKQHHARTHRLVAKAFISNPENKPQVNHKDANKLNNNVDNLEWVTLEENHTHANQMNLFYQPKLGIDNGKSKLTPEQVINIRNEYKKGVTTLKFLADKYEVDLANIHLIVTRKIWRHI